MARVAGNYSTCWPTPNGGEWEADKLQYRLAQKLFALEDEMKPTDIFLWSGVFQELGVLANSADKTAERLRRMLHR